MLINASDLSKLDQDHLAAALPYCLTETHLPWGKKYVGKVRDTYDLGDELLIIVTDRLSAFDRMLAVIPYKGQVLNLISKWWFEQTASLIPNHVIATPDPNVALVHKCKVFPIEFVVRGYITGTTSTSLWTQYEKGVRDYCGVQFKEGLQKNEKLAQAVLTPTTKSAEHDRPITPTEIIAEGWMTAADWEEASQAALALFEAGTKIAAQRNLILVDTKYEFGRDKNGQLRVVDEVHTPDSSRYWLAQSYEQRIAAKLEPENIDKEFLRLWFAKHCDPYQDKELPEAPVELVLCLAARYILLYEMITGEVFSYPDKLLDVSERINKRLTELAGTKANFISRITSAR
ncbi:MAG: phosphoribosylaminoimidazolesuccinocarboxamide synthase [Gammaproteobacteria bacterium]|nr:phosphoribosylaminoimidazolesuccinocarboxamide synthase [Gammaproteobacteria bacterium]